MADLEKAIIREPGTRTAKEYAHRIYELSAIYSTLLVASIGGIFIIVWQAQLLVTLTQRSNVETLVLVFFLVFFAYIALISRSGALGTAKILYYNFVQACCWRRMRSKGAKLKPLGLLKVIS